MRNSARPTVWEPKLRLIRRGAIAMGYNFQIPKLKSQLNFKLEISNSDGLTPISPDRFVWFKLIPCSARILDRDGLQIRIGSALPFADTNVFSMVSINSVPVFRSGGAGENKWLVPSDLVY